MDTTTWLQCKLQEGELFCHRIGPLSVFLKKQLNEIWIAGSRDDKLGGNLQQPGDDINWIRTALPEEFEEFQLSPAFPDRPVVIDTENVYRFFSQTDTKIYTRIPVFVRITPVLKPDLVITEIPVRILSETWFGAFTEGELSYALSTTARRTLNEVLIDPHLIICPIKIKNISEQELKFEKICLRVEHLSIFKNKNTLWADETEITYYGKERNSEINVKGAPPEEAKSATLVTPPRKPARENIGKKTFKLLRDFHVPGF